MTNSLIIAAAFATMTIILVMIPGAVKRNEKFPFVAGVVLFAAGPLLVAGGVSTLIGGLVGLVGAIMIVGSTIPLLRQSPETS